MTEPLTLGLPSFVLRWVRDDRATLHDLLSGTRAVRAVRAPGRRWRVGAALACPILALLYLQLFVVHALHEIKVAPVERKLADAGAFPTPTPWPKEAIAKPVGAGGVRLADASRVELDACRVATEPGEFRVRLEGESFDVRVRARQRALFGFLGPEGEAAIAEIGWLASLYGGIETLVRWNPLAASSHARAAEAARFGVPDFGLFRPIENLALLASKITWVIGIPNALRHEGIRYAIHADATTTGYLTLFRLNGRALLEGHFTRDGEEKRIELSGPDVGDALDHLVSSARWEPAAFEAELPTCESAAQMAARTAAAESK